MATQSADVLVAGRRFNVLVALVVLIAVPLVLFVLITSRRPEPFSTSIDNYFYFSPLIAAQSEAWFAGEVPRVVWGVGAGWTPWQSGQTGVLWPLYLMAAAIARASAGVLSLLEVSALLSTWSSALVAYWLLPSSIGGWWRVAVACALSTTAGPLVLGLTWHNYLAPAPAALAVVLLAARIAREGSTRGLCVGIIVASLLFFAGAHVQMYAIGVVFIALLIVGVGDDWAARLRALVWLGIAQVPLALPLLFFKLLAGNMAPGWLRSHMGQSLLSTTAVSTIDAVVGTVAGDLASATFGRGAYFNPLFVALPALLIGQRRVWLTPFVAVAVLLIAPRLFPGIDHLTVGPFDGFRWPRKVMVFVAPMTLIVCALLAPGAGRLGWVLRSVPLWALIVLLQILVVRDTAAQSTLRDAQALGTSVLVQRAQACLQQLSIPMGARIAVAGHFKGGNRPPPLPLAFLGMANNAALLVGLESSHLYEPMEQADVAAQHGALSSHWRKSVAPENLRGSGLTQEVRALASYGTQFLIAARVEDLGDLANVRVCNVDNQRVFAAAVPGASVAIPSFPAYDVDGDQRESFERSASGTLTTLRAFTQPPRFLGGPVALSWRQLEDGRWRGSPQTPPLWVSLGSAVLCTLVVALALLWHRPRRGP